MDSSRLTRAETSIPCARPHPFHFRDLGGAVATRLARGLNDVMVQTRIRVGIRSPDQCTTPQPASHRPSCWLGHSKTTWGLGQLRAGPSRASVVQLTCLWLLTGTEQQCPPSLNQPPISTGLYYVLSVESKRPLLSPGKAGCILFWIHPPVFFLCESDCSRYLLRTESYRICPFATGLLQWT